MAHPGRIRYATGVVLIILFPVLLHAEGLSLVADLEYNNITENRTEKATGIVTDTESSRFSQLYQLDISRYVFPYLSFDLGGYYAVDKFNADINIADEFDFSSDTTEKTIRPYAEVRLTNPIFMGSLAYRSRDSETSSSTGLAENLMVNEYDATFNWRPIDFPLLNMHYMRLETQDDPLTFDSTTDLFTLISKYLYRDFSFFYGFTSQENVNNIEGLGNITRDHNGSARYSKVFDYKGNRFITDASAKLIYNTTEFTGGESFIDRPASGSGTPFYIFNDVPPTINDPSELTLVDAANPLTNINIGRNGGLNPVSAGLSFGVAVEVETIYIDLSEDTQQYPDLATPSQVSAIAGSFNWRFYSSDDPTELNWTEQPISSATYDSVENRFEIRLASSVSARRIKVTTTPLTVVAPGEIRYANIRAFTSVAGRAGQTTENLEQFYNVGVRWVPSERTTVGYEGSYNNQDAKDEDSTRTSWTNSVFFRRILSPVFLTYGRVFLSDRTRTTPSIVQEDTDLNYSLGLTGDYLETLSQTLLYTGTNSTGTNIEGSDKTNTVILRTNADLYTGWSMYLDLGYTFNAYGDGTDLTSKNVRTGTTVEPNRRLSFSLDYTIEWSELTNQPDRTYQLGTFQALWAITNTLNLYYRYNFSDQKGGVNTSTRLSEFNINWAPFPDGDIQFSISYNESLEAADKIVKTITPVIHWKVASGVFLDLRYASSTFDSPLESGDIDSFIVKFRIFY